MTTKGMCPKCGGSFNVTAQNKLRTHGTCGSISVEKAAGLVELKSKPKAAAGKKPVKRTTSAKKAAGTRSTKKAARRK